MILTSAGFHLALQFHPDLGRGLVFATEPFFCYSQSVKSGIHPTYYPEAKITCACGQTYTIGSTIEKMEVEICGACHPFYTGQDKIVDTAGRVEKFKNRAAKAQESKPKNVKKVTAEKADIKKPKAPAKNKAE